MSKDRRKDLRLVEPEGAVDPDRLDEETAALRAALGGGGSLDEMDHEALLAMTLGDEISEIDEGEAAEAARLARALVGEGAHPLAELGVALRAAHGATLDRDDEAGDHDDEAGVETDLELIVALSLGVELSLDESVRRRAGELRQALEHGDQRHPAVALARSLRFADGAGALDDADGEALLALAGLEDVAIGEARRQAEGLRDALEGEGDHPLVPLTTALRAADDRLPRLDDLRHQRALNGALDHHGARRQGRGVILGAIVALAAGIALFAGSMSWLETRAGGPTASRAPAAAPIEARSTQELFDPAEPFPARGGESERMGRIVEARAADLRANRFAAWGVQ